MILIKGLSFKKIAAITLFPFILFSDKSPTQTLVRHEQIHIRQQLECLIIFFYLWYGIEWCIHYYQLRDFWKAYRQVSFEKEAYASEAEPDYLKKRRVWAFLKWV